MCCVRELKEVNVAEGVLGGNGSVNVLMAVAYGWRGAISNNGEELARCSVANGTSGGM
jgi:hypothetical protein